MSGGRRLSSPLLLWLRPFVWTSVTRDLMHGRTPHPLPPPPAMLRPMTLLLLVARAEAWVTISQSYWGAQLNDIRAQMGVNTSVAVEPVQRLGYLWTSPAESASERGMGGGLTWAIDPNLCENLLSSFQEQPFLGISFVTCREIQAALHRGFSAWADNSAKLRFVDVSKECVAAGFTDATCPLAKIFVTWLTPANLQALDGNGRRRLAHGPHADDSGPDTEHSLISAERQSKGGDTAALARSFPGYTNTFRRCAAKSPDDFFLLLARLHPCVPVASLSRAAQTASSQTASSSRRHARPFRSTRSSAGTSTRPFALPSTN